MFHLESVGDLCLVTESLLSLLKLVGELSDLLFGPLIFILVTLDDVVDVGQLSLDLHLLLEGQLLLNHRNVHLLGARSLLSSLELCAEESNFCVKLVDLTLLIFSKSELPVINIEPINFLIQIVVLLSKLIIFTALFFQNDGVLSLHVHDFSLLSLASAEHDSLLDTL